MSTVCIRSYLLLACWHTVFHCFCFWFLYVVFICECVCMYVWVSIRWRLVLGLYRQLYCVVIEASERPHCCRWLPSDGTHHQLTDSNFYSLSKNPDMEKIFTIRKLALILGFIWKQILDWSNLRNQGASDIASMKVLF